MNSKPMKFEMGWFKLEAATQYSSWKYEKSVHIISNGWSYLSKCPYKIKFNCDQHHFNEKREICKYLMCDKQYYNLVAF